jgi:hypothetical protein
MYSGKVSFNLYIRSVNKHNLNYQNENGKFWGFSLWSFLCVRSAMNGWGSGQVSRCLMTSTSLKLSQIGSPPFPHLASRCPCKLELGAPMAPSPSWICIRTEVPKTYTLRKLSTIKGSMFSRKSHCCLAGFRARGARVHRCPGQNQDIALTSAFFWQHTAATLSDGLVYSKIWNFFHIPVLIASI